MVCDLLLAIRRRLVDEVISQEERDLWFPRDSGFSARDLLSNPVRADRDRSDPSGSY